MNPVRAMLFDLDGTLLDSAPDLVRSLNWVRRSEGLDPLPVEDCARFASKGALGLLQAGMPAAGQAQFETWRERFLAHYAEHSCIDSRLYDGIPELLATLAMKGVRWGIVTNKVESLTWPIIDAMQFTQRPGSVVCGDTLPRKKPDPAPVLLACRQLDADPAETVFVGDDVRDIQAGEAAGTRTAAVLYGYGSHELHGDVIANSVRIGAPGDLLRLVQ
ncbi:MAG: HAD-IA family hydrolase [Xanthomonadales bacterium]